MYMHLSHCSVTNAGLDNLPCKAANFTFLLQPVNDHDKPLAHGKHDSDMLEEKSYVLVYIFAFRMLDSDSGSFGPQAFFGCFYE